MIFAYFIQAIKLTAKGHTKCVDVRTTSNVGQGQIGPRLSRQWTNVRLILDGRLPPTNMGVARNCSALISVEYWFRVGKNCYST